MGNNSIANDSTKMLDTKVKDVGIMFLGVILLYLLYLLYRGSRRMVYTTDLPDNYVGYTFYGIVTHVGDGDGFKIYHVPRFRSSRYTESSPTLKIRLAGIDAPEVRFYNKPAQEYAYEARDFLKNLIFKKKVKVVVMGIDIYNRILAYVFVKVGWFRWKNVNLEMVKSGMACLYIGRNVNYGEYKDDLFKHGAEARVKKKGMWKNKNLILPEEYKKMYR